MSDAPRVPPTKARSPRHPDAYVCQGCGIFSREPICRNCRHTDRRYGTRTTPARRRL